MEVFDDIGRTLRMDEIDRRIVALLVDDGRASYRELGEQVGLSAPAVKPTLHLDQMGPGRVYAYQSIVRANTHMAPGHGATRSCKISCITRRWAHPWLTSASTA